MRWIPVLAVALLVAGCGATTTRTKTVTETRTVEVEVPAEVAPEPAPTDDADFCGSDAGDALAQGDTEAQNAFNNTDSAAFKRAVSKVMTAAHEAPDGAQCAADALNAVASYANTGAGNLPGLDLHAIVKRIRSFEDAHSLSRTR